MKQRISALMNNQYTLSLFKKANTILFGFIASACLSRALGPALKGEYAVVANYVAILTVILNLGITTVFPNYYRKKENWTISTFFMVSFVQFLLFLAAGCIVSYVIGTLQFFVIMLYLVFGIFAVQLNNMNAILSFKGNAVVNISAVIANAIAMIFVFMFAKRNLTAVYCAIVLKELVIIVISLWYLRKHIHIRQVKASEWPIIIKVGILPMLSNLLVFVNYRIDIIMLKWLRVESYQIGLYSAGIALADYAWIIPDAFKDVLGFRTARKDDIKSITFGIRASSTIMFLIFIVLAVFGKYIIAIMNGWEYVGAYPVTVLIFAGIYSMIYYKLIGTLYIAQGKYKFYFFSLLAAVTTNVISNFFLIQIWGIYGAVLTTIVSYSIAGYAFLLHFKRQYRLKFRQLLLVNKQDIRLLWSFAKGLFKGRQKGEK